MADLTTPKRRFESTGGGKNKPAGMYPAGEASVAWVQQLDFLLRNAEGCYFSEVLMASNLLLRFVPTPFTTAMIARAIPAAIRPYSMAVAPDSSVKNLRKIRCKSASC